MVGYRRVLPRAALLGVLALLLLGAPARAQQAREGGVLLVVDTPADGATVAPTVSLAGWALDAARDAGPGIDRVEVYLDGPRGAGALLGTATYGLSRADVALFRRNPTVSASGWALDVTLPSGSHTLYLYAHREGSPDSEGWSGPQVLTLRVQGDPVATIAEPNTSPRRAPTAAPTAVTARSGTCLVTDHDSGRCLVRNRNRSPENPTNHVLPGSWTVLGFDGTGAGGSERTNPTEVSVLAHGLAGTGFVYGMPIDLSSLMPHAGAPGADSGVRVAPGAAGGAAAAPNYVPAALTLTATPLGSGQFALAWNPLSNAQLYEVRRCPAFSTPTATCTVIALVQSSGYQFAAADGVYLVRAVGPQGQAQGESNRVYLCCRG
ncbi:MAG: hypothetical protein IRZ14_02915 [Chloroflexi bacterium]|nr:hypothetical protein [Chloroflexota bacterium]